MRRTWVKVIIVLMAMMFMGAGAAQAGQFVFGQHAKQMAAYDVQMADLKAKTAVATQASKDAYARQDKLMAPFKIVTCPLPAIGYGILALRSPTKSPLEYLVVPSICRGVNTAKNYMIQTAGGGAVDMVTAPFEAKGTTYAPVMGEMGVMAKRTMERGPIANVLETASYATPISCFGAGVLGPIAATSLPWTMTIVSTTVPVGATAVGEAAGMAEKKLVK